MKNLIFVCCCCFFSVILHAKDTITIVRGNGNYFPLEYMENGQLTGVHIEIIEAVADKLGLKVKFDSLPWSRGLLSFKLGKYDGMLNVSRTEAREKFAHFLAGNILSSVKTFPIILARRKNEINFDGNLTSLTPFKIAVGKDYKYGAPFDTASFLLKYEIPSPSQVVLTRLLNLERVDVIIGSRRNLLQVHSKQEIDNLYHIFDQPAASDDSYLVFSKSRNTLTIAHKFAVAVNKYKSSEEYTELLQKYKNIENSHNYRANN